jgi:hypothetical protein
VTCGDKGGRCKNGEPCKRAARNGGKCAIHTGEAKVGRPRELATDEELRLIEQFAPQIQQDELCLILRIPQRTFQDMVRRDPRISASYKEGRARLKARLGQTATRLALGQRETVQIDKKGKRTVVVEEVRPDTQMLKFVLERQHNWRPPSVELSGPQGGPIPLEHEIPYDAIADARAAIVRGMAGSRAHASENGR